MHKKVNTGGLDGTLHLFRRRRKKNENYFHYSTNLHRDALEIFFDIFFLPSLIKMYKYTFIYHLCAVNIFIDSHIIYMYTMYTSGTPKRADRPRLRSAWP